MKRIFCILLSALLLVSAMSFVSCASEPEATPVADIKGKTPEQALSDAMAYIENAEGYGVTIDIGAKIKVAFVTVPVEADDVYEYSYYGDDAHHFLTEDGEAFITNELIAGLTGDSYSSGALDKESWYVDGVYYRVTLNGEKLKSVEQDVTIADGAVEKAINAVVEKYAEGASCYESEGKTYFEVVLDEGNTRIGPFKQEKYRVYFDDDGRIEKTMIRCEESLYTFDIELNYSYDAEPIAVPADAESFTVVE